MTQAGKIYSLIPQIMKRVGAIEKDRTNSQGSGYKFRGIDDVYNAMQGPLAEAGVFCAPKVLKSEREERLSKAGGNLIYTILTVEFRFYADDGSCFETVTVGEAMDSGDKSANKAMSAAMKYAFLQVFCIPTIEDKDTETQTHEVLPKKETAETKTSEPTFGSLTYVSPSKPFNSGVYCKVCNTNMILSKSGAAYFCPRWQESEGHDRFPADQLQGVINAQNIERAKARV